MLSSYGDDIRVHDPFNLDELPVKCFYFEEARDY